MTEYQEQANVIEWARMQESFRPALKVLNGSLSGVRLTTGQSVKAKRSGMKKGYPDLSLPVPRRGFHGLYLEVKRTGGVPSDVKDEQMAWMNILNSLGYHACLAFGFDEAVFLIDWYLQTGGDNPTKSRAVGGFHFA